MSKRELPKSGEIYKHFKNKMYQIITVATHTETGEQLVVYEALYDDFKMYARPVSMFLSEVDHEKYPEVTQKYRFELIEREVDGTLKMGYPVKKQTVWGEKVIAETQTQTQTQIEEKANIQKSEVAEGKTELKKSEQEDKVMETPKKPEQEDRVNKSLKKPEDTAKTDAEVKREQDLGEENKRTILKMTKEEYLDEDEEINPFLLSFLDTDSYSEKLQVLVSIRSRLDDRLIDDMAAALDVTVEEGPLPVRYESLKTCLDAMVKFECGRLR